MATGGTFSYIDLHGTGLPIPLDQVLRTRADADSALQADRGIVNGRLPSQNVNGRPLDVDDPFVLYGTPHFATMTAGTSLRQGDQRLQHRLPPLSWNRDAL